MYFYAVHEPLGWVVVQRGCASWQHHHHQAKGSSINHVLSTHLTRINILFPTTSTLLSHHNFNCISSNMSKLFALLTLLCLLRYPSAVLAQVPPIPSIWDPTYPMNRCIDFCAFLRPGLICPAERYNPNCLCAVYNIRLPAVYPSQGLNLMTVRGMLESEECDCCGWIAGCVGFL